MGEALGAADEVVVMDVYVAREDPEPGVNGALVASHVPLPADRVRLRAVLVRDAAAALVERARPGDLVLTLGAGDVTLVGPEVLELLAERRAMLRARPDSRAEQRGEDPDEQTVRVARRRFARRQWARRWLAWRPILVALLLLGLAGAAGLAGALLLGPRRGLGPT